ncbi:hypothetical protein BJY01DRAFT_249437 [Aspergillus pseudoustus]|uniref:Nucleoside phosphorylase domain-containing protein n=1 Tax=Aspergillus pseudoustus TaxID=1810923 RepID=A0ABR4JRH9_9EURO
MTWAKPRHRPTEPKIHFGLFASGDKAMKSMIHHQAISSDVVGVLGFEMEGAGAWETISTTVVKSVCDYADSHKHKLWQDYAALRAACCAKALLSLWLDSRKQPGVLSEDTPITAEERRPSGHVFHGSAFVNNGSVTNQAWDQVINGDFTIGQTANQGKSRGSKDT